MKELHERIGVSPKGEYAALRESVDSAYQSYRDAEKALREHIREHGC